MMRDVLTIALHTVANPLHRVCQMTAPLKCSQSLLAVAWPAGLQVLESCSQPGLTETAERQPLEQRSAGQGAADLPPAQVARHAAVQQGDRP